MTRSTWEELPETIREAIQGQTGPIVKAEDATSGIMPGLTVRLHTDDGGSVFVKAIQARSPGASLHVRERWAATVLPPQTPAPSMMWAMDVSGWHVMLFEYVVDARHADLSPGSADLPAVLEVVAGLDGLLTPAPPRAPLVSDNIAPLVAKGRHLLDGPSSLPDRELFTGAVSGFDANAFEGNTLLHYDLSEGNLLICPAGVRVIDWSFAAKGASWIEAVMLGPRLIQAGHSPAQTENLLESVPAWRSAPPEAVTGLVALWTLFRLYKAARGPESSRIFRAQAAEAGRTWLRFRTGCSGA